jgi:mono/diheme cytochrome c family protein
MMRRLMRRRRPVRRAVLALAVPAVALGLSACGSQGIEVKDQAADVNHGAKLFSERCSGCHTLDSVGAEGGAYNVHDRERVDGPNFNVRKEDVEDILYAIRNGGFSGAIMPENIVVGKDAVDVANFLSKYSGVKAKKGAGPG